MTSCRLPMIFGFVLVVCRLFIVSQPVNAFNDDEEFPCMSISNRSVIPEDGTLLSICLVDPSAPEGSSVSEMNVKILVDHPDPRQLEILLSRSDSPIMKTLPSSEITQDGAGSYIHIHDFDGLDSLGEWVIQIRDTVSGTSGILLEASIAPFYAPVHELPIPTSDNGGKSTSERLPADAIKIAGGFESGEDKDIEGLPETQYDGLDSIVMMNQTFEGVFPSPEGGWEIFDANPNDGNEYYWDDDDLRPYSGYWAAWPARGGADGIDPTSSTTYPKNMDTWMIYGPFDLSNAKSAQVEFMLWRHIEVYWDHIFFGISSDRMTFSGWSWDGDAGWDNIITDLSTYLGDSDVWIGWHFVSDGSVQYEGPWIDNIMLTFTPADVMVEGQFRFYDRLQQLQPARDITFEIWDKDNDYDDDLL